MRFFRNRFAITKCIASNFDYRTRENEIGQTCATIEGSIFK